MVYATDDEPLVQQDIVKEQQTLTSDEIAFVKDLFAKSQFNNEQQFFVNNRRMLVVPVMVGPKKTTGISVYTEKWDRWDEFMKNMMARILRNSAFFVSQKRSEPLQNLSFWGIV